MADAPNQINKYMDTLRKARVYPDDPFKHAYSLIDTDDDVIVTFSKLVEKRILLANISDDRMLRFYQNDVILLCQFLDMARREPSLENFFLKTYYGWVGELALTRTKDGMERKLQATAGGYAPRSDMAGYGAQMPQFQAGGMEKEETNLFKKLFSGNKLRQQNQQR
jgi:hypothetical protein